MKKSLVILASLIYSNISYGDFSASGHARFRVESRNDVGYKAAAHDNKLFRFRPNFHWIPDPHVKVLVEPQFARTFGSDGNSGGVTDPNLSLHRAQIEAYWNNIVEFTIGRQALSYGDQLILSTLEWANVARSFDAIKARFFIPFATGRVDIIDATMDTNGTSNTLTDDLTLRGAYSTWSFGPYLKEFDLYYLVKDQQNTTTADVVNKMWGVRLKTKHKGFLYRIEHTSQKTETRDGTTADMKGKQTNVELGYTVRSIKTRFSAQWFNANEEFDHMMPLAHAYLGIADVLGRSNINGYAFHVKSILSSRLKLELDYLIFERDSIRSDAISAAPNQIAKTATSFASASNSKKLGSEIDFVATYKATRSSRLSLGAALFMPGTYFKEYTAGGLDKNKDNIKFAYLQYSVKF